MKKEENKKINSYFFIGIIFLLIFLSYKIIQPFLITIISSFILAYLSKPLYNKLSKKINSKLSAIICIFLILLIFILPLTIIFGAVTTQTINYFTEDNINAWTEKISSIKGIDSLSLNINETLNQSYKILYYLLTSAAKYLPTMLITLLVLVFGIYYILTGWDTLSDELQKYLPFKNKKKTLNEISTITKHIIYGTILIAILQFIVSAIGFYLSGIEFYLILPTLIFFLAFIPGLGPALIWIPLAIYYAIIQNWTIFTGVLITGIILSVVLDTIVRSTLLGNKTKTNPFIMLLGILGGISLFGVFGFIVGPLILIYTIELTKEITKK